MAQLGSYARTVVGGFNELADLVHQYGGNYNDNGDHPALAAIISREEIDRALAHPHAAYLQDVMEAFFQYVRTHSDQIAQYEAVRLQLGQMLEALPMMESQMEQVPLDDRQAAQMEIQEAKLLFRQLSDYAKTLRESLDAVDGEYQKMVVDVKSVSEQYQQQREQTLQKVIDVFSNNDYPLNDDEMAQLQADTPWHEVVAQFTALAIDLPKDVDLDTPDFATYYKLKSYVVMAASMQRRGEKVTAKELFRQ